jgi:hypothetical protein
MQKNLAYVENRVTETYCMHHVYHDVSKVRSVTRAVSKSTRP